VPLSRRATHTLSPYDEALSQLVIRINRYKRWSAMLSLLVASLLVSDGTPPTNPTTVDRVRRYMTESLRTSPAARDRTKAPPLPRWPSDLTSPGCEIFRNAECAATLDLRTVCFDEATAAALDMHLATVEENQVETQRRIDAGWDALADFKAASDLRHERDVAAIADLGWKDWQVAGVAIGSLVVGALVAGITVSIVR
jgi:hypothetical protein